MTWLGGPRQQPQSPAISWVRRELSARSIRVRRSLAQLLAADAQRCDPQYEDREAEP
jgi:hypothetical protein